MKRNAIRSIVLLAAVAPALALASVGKITVLEGKAERLPAGGKAVALAVGSEIEVNDTITVAPKGNVKLTLNDASVVMIGSDSQLVIDEGSFKDQERQGFSARLVFGKVWSKVTKALSGSEAKFNVTTDRAVAGVRGTIFRVDATKLVKTAARSKFSTVVRVAEGRVAVDYQVRAAAQAQTASAKKGPRTQVAGPQQISRDEWEKKFVELQANQQVAVGDLDGKVGAYEDSAKKDAFAQFVDKHQ